MNFLEIFCLSLALAVDVFVVSFAYGIIMKRNYFYVMFRLALICGFMQGFMPFIGYYGTSFIGFLFEGYVNILVFIVFMLLGGNVFMDALRPENKRKVQKLTLKVSLAISIITSIDALVSGAMLYLTKTSLFCSVLIIGIVSFLSTILAFNLNCCFKKVPEKYLQLFSGTILVGLGIKNLFY